MDTQSGAAETNDIPPDDDKPVTSLGGLHNPWMQPLRSWIIRQPKVTRDLIPDTDEFWREPAWCIGGTSSEWFGILVSTDTQAKLFKLLNEDQVRRGEVVVPCWGPADLERYFGPFLSQVDDAQRVRCIAAVQADMQAGFLAGLKRRDQESSSGT